MVDAIAMGAMMSMKRISNKPERMDSSVIDEFRFFVAFHSGIRIAAILNGHFCASCRNLNTPSADPIEEFSYISVNKELIFRKPRHERDHLMY